jgi:superfamily II DNA or RNA helicase
LPAAIKDGYLSRIEAQTIPLKLDLSEVGMSAGDFKAGDLGTALDPYLGRIAEEMVSAGCLERKTVVFLPLIKTAQKFRDLLEAQGFAAAEVNGESKDRAEVLADFDSNKYNVLCNSMLLTEGWDQPDVDCIVVLRPTKIRSLYCQMVGRGTRISPGKDNLLLLDFLWHTSRHELCHPANLIAQTEEVASKMTESIASAPGFPVDIEVAERQAQADVVKEREEALAKKLRELKDKKRKLVDPLQFELSINAADLIDYSPEFGWEVSPPSEAQLSALEGWGLDGSDIANAGIASKLLDRLQVRRDSGLSTPKQIRQLESRGFVHVGTWSMSDASAMITRIAANGWKTPRGVAPSEYVPSSLEVSYV